MQIAVLGLGKMGKNIALKLMKEGHEVVAWNRSRDALEQFRQEETEYVVNGKLALCHSLEELRDTLQKPRLAWVMLPAGEATDNVLSQILESGVLEQGDVLIEGGNSNYHDTERRAKLFEQKMVKYLGIGVSGGVYGITNGYPMMVGGNQSGYEYVKPVLDSLAKPNGMHTYFGPGGAGHFVKMVHNGIEYGMMQAIAEGFATWQYCFQLSCLGHTAGIDQRSGIVTV
jgi:6-phosphogluconate dehydrogenase